MREASSRACATEADAVNAASLNAKPGAGGLCAGGLAVTSRFCLFFYLFSFLYNFLEQGREMKSHIENPELIFELSQNAAEAST